LQVQKAFAERFVVEPAVYKEKPLFSLMIPVYNEADIIINSLNALHKLLESEDYELIVFDDCSEDGTYDKLKGAIRSLKDPEIVLMHSVVRVGKGGSIKRAVDMALGEVVLIMDADLSVDLKDIRKLVKEARDTGEVVIGQRSISDRFTQGFLRVVLTLGYNAIVRLLFQTGLIDHQCGFKAMNTDVARKLMPKIKSNGYVFDTELIVVARKFGVPLRQIRVKWTDRRLRKSNLKWVKTSVTMMKDLLNIRRVYAN
jgi:glycosyltransferase involved in cell wall biosynthesis